MRGSIAGQDGVVGENGRQRSTETMSQALAIVFVSFLDLLKLDDTGGRIVFCSDGIIEAGIPSEEIFGFQRTSETIRSLCAEQNSTSERIIEGLLQRVNDFPGIIAGNRE